MFGNMAFMLLLLNQFDCGDWEWSLRDSGLTVASTGDGEGLQTGLTSGAKNQLQLTRE